MARQKVSAATLAAYGQQEDDDDDDDKGTPQASLTDKGDADVVMVGNSDAEEHREVEIEVAVEEDDEKEIKKAERQATRDAYGDEDDEDERLGVDEDEALNEQRPSRRAKRNAQRREYRDRNAEELALLRQQVAELRSGQVGTQRSQVSLALNSVESQLRAARGALAIADAELADAVKNSDGERYKQAQAERDATLLRVNQLASYGQRLQQVQAQMEDPRYIAQQQAALAPVQPQQRGTPAPQEAKAERYAEIFVDRHPWFDPDGTDAKSIFVRSLDEALAAEGFLSHTPEYWRQLERRVKEAGLGAGAQEQDDPPPRQRATERRPAPRRAGPPTAAVRSTSKPGKATFTLHPDMVQYLEREGLDKPRSQMTDKEKAKYDRVTTAWRKGQQQLSNSAR